MVLGIDPGPELSAYVLWDGVTVWDFGILPNEELLDLLDRLNLEAPRLNHIAVEMIASYGMAVGKTVFDTCVWIGRFIERWKGDHCLIFRRDIKLHLCESSKAKDANIRQALVDRFAYGFGNYGKGNKANPSNFYGFKKDIWQAMAVAVTVWDTRKKRAEAVALAMEKKK